MASAVGGAAYASAENLHRDASAGSSEPRAGRVASYDFQVTFLAVGIRCGIHNGGCRPPLLMWPYGIDPHHTTEDKQTNKINKNKIPNCNSLTPDQTGAATRIIHTEKTFKDYYYDCHFFLNREEKRSSKAFFSLSVFGQWKNKKIDWLLELSPGKKKTPSLVMCVTLPCSLCCWRW